MALKGQYILGYDARKLWDDRFSAPEQREAFLSRLDVERVLSVDAASWPSVFPVDSNTRPEYVGFFQDLWEDLDSLRSHLAKTTQIRTRPADIIAVALDADLLKTDAKLRIPAIVSSGSGDVSTGYEAVGAKRR